MEGQGKGQKTLEKQGFHACPASCSAETHLLQLTPDITEQLLIVPVVSVHQGGDSLSGEKPMDVKLWSTAASALLAAQPLPLLPSA